jgi:DnaJ like chaperone protein
MAKYEKWLGASLGWMLTGNPIGGLLGFFAGTMMQGDTKNKKSEPIKGVSEFEVNLMVIASHLIKLDGHISAAEVAFTEKFLNTHFDEAYADERSRLFQYCLQKEYDLNAACGQVRMYTQLNTKVQVVRFLVDLATCDGEITERKNYFIFRIAGYLNVNDVEYRKIKLENINYVQDAYEILGVTVEMSYPEIRTTYRRLVLKYHPDRNKDASEEEKKKLGRKFQQIQEAYQKIKLEKEG